MEYYGQIKDIFIPGCRERNGKTVDHMKAPYLAFVIKVFVYKQGKRIAAPELPNEIIIIESDSWESASMCVNDWVNIPVSVIKGYDDWDGYNRVFLNLCNTPCIAKVTHVPQE